MAKNPTKDTVEKVSVFNFAISCLTKLEKKKTTKEICKFNNSYLLQLKNPQKLLITKLRVF